MAYIHLWLRILPSCHPKAYQKQTRALLAQSVREVLGEVHLSWSAEGKPLVSGGHHVSVSHHKNLWAMAWGPSSLGLDLEKIKDHRQSSAILARYGSMRENAWYAKQADPSSAFLKLWTAKEAAAKYFSDPGFEKLGVYQVEGQQVVGGSYPLSLLSFGFASYVGALVTKLPCRLSLYRSEVDGVLEF